MMTAPHTNFIVLSGGAGYPERQIAKVQSNHQPSRPGLT